MEQNIEIKARLPDQSIFIEIKKILTSKTGKDGTVIHQKDTFFLSPNGRLKLREETIDKPTCSLIFYVRIDQPGPKQSDFVKTEIPDPDNMKKILSGSVGYRGEVCKERLLFMVGQTRVHLDRVDGLGVYLELEVKMKPEQSKEEAIQIADQLMAELKIDQSWLMSDAYIDIIESKARETSNSQLYS